MIKLKMIIQEDKLKYNKQNYSVRDSRCKKLIGKCFLPFSGNGQYICRKYEMGQCPNEEETKKLLKLKTETTYIGKLKKKDREVLDKSKQMFARELQVSDMQTE